MSTSKMDKSGVFNPVCLSFRETYLMVPCQWIRFRKNGVEFASEQPFDLWTEVVLDLHSPDDGRRVHGAGVVVECKRQGNGKHWVSILLTGLSNSAASHLEQLAAGTQLF